MQLLRVLTPMWPTSAPGLAQVCSYSASLIDLMGPTAPPPAIPSMMEDDYNEPTVVSAPTFNHPAANDDMRTINTGFRAARTP